MIVEVVCPIPIFKTFDYLYPDHLPPVKDLIGRRVLIPFGFKSSVGIVCGAKDQSTTSPEKLKAITSLLDDEPLLTPAMMDLGRWLSDRYVCSLGEALFALLPPRRSETKAIRETGGVTPSPSPLVPPEAPIVPSDEQKEALQILTTSLNRNQFAPFLLMGVAATGKTEVYRVLIEHVLAQGKNALVLAPEIGLVEQLGQMLISRFGDQVLIFHSNVSSQKRIDDWTRIRRGEARIVIGARSTILAPMDHLGVVIVDEEHDSAYKEDRKPRFHVRDVAWERARQNSCLLIYGGATPSLELWHKAHQGEVQLIELHNRVVSSPKPQIELVDLKKERTRGLLSPRLIEEMGQRLRVHEQIILFLNRRGFFRYLKCPHCSWVARCPKCGIALVHHKTTLGPKKVSKETGYWCHYCSYMLTAVNRCPDCGKTELFSGGFGTQRIEEEIQTQFPWVHVVRWDRDTSARKGQQKSILEGFQTGKFDILIGTQIVAQGLHIPNVTLVGVLDADSQLHIPDFRSAERTFQLVTQVAGRSGRGDITGRVFIQTHHPDHYALRFAAAMDINAFAAHELKFREELHYPPFRRLVRINLFGKNAEKNAQHIVGWAQGLALHEPLYGLGPAVVKKIKGKGPVQYQTLFKIAPIDFVLFLKLLKEKISPHPSDYLIDVDPESLA